MKLTVLPAGNADDEIAALIEVLHRTGQRLEELTAGEVDTVADREGRTFVLRHAQEQLRHNEAARQAAILNGLPAHIALLDPQGVVISVNAAWRGFADANAMHGPGHGIGVNYLAVCDRARGTGATEAAQVAGGIRAVLEGKAKSFSIEYPCHSPTEQRWFLLTVTPLAEDAPNGAIAMHLNITTRKQAEHALAALSDQTQRRERLLSTTLANISDFAYAYDREGRFLFVNQPLLDLWGITLEAAVGKNFAELGYPADLAAQLQRQVQQVFETKRSVRDETAYVSPAGLPGY